MNIFEAIATSDPHVICRTANAIDTGETYVTAAAALHTLGLDRTAFVIVDDGLTFHTKQTLCEAYDWELPAVQRVLESDECRPMTHSTSLVMDWFTAQYE